MEPLSHNVGRTGGRIGLSTKPLPKARRARGVVITGTHDRGVAPTETLSGAVGCFLLPLRSEKPKIRTAFRKEAMAVRRCCANLYNG